MTDTRTLRDEIAEAVTAHRNGDAADSYAMADAILDAIRKTDRLIDRGRVFRVMQTDWNDANDEYQDFTVYTAPNEEPTEEAGQ